MDRPAKLAPLILCVHGSPRRRGNTDLLLDALADGVTTEGGRVEHIRVASLRVGGCSGCGSCEATGVCSVRDAMEDVYERVDGANALVVAAPVYFLGVPAQLKTVIDRFQCRWSGKYVLDMTPGAPRPGAFLSTAGAPSRSVFTCLERTVDALFDVLGVTSCANLCYENVDQRRAVRSHPTALEDARRLGGELVRRCRPALELSD